MGVAQKLESLGLKKWGGGELSLGALYKFTPMAAAPITEVYQGMHVTLLFNSNEVAIIDDDIV